MELFCHKSRQRNYRYHVVKGSVWRRIFAKNSVVNTAEEFFLQSNEQIKIQFVSMDQINEHFQKLVERWQKKK